LLDKQEVVSQLPQRSVGFNTLFSEWATNDLP